MANVVRDPKANPEAVLGDFSKPDPVRTFDLGDVAFVYGSRWKQRYWAKQGDDYYVLPAQWDIKHSKARLWGGVVTDVSGGGGSITVIQTMLPRAKVANALPATCPKSK